MKNHITDIKIADIYGQKLNGNYLYSDSKKHYFYNKYSHTLFYIDKTKNTNDNEYGNLFINFERYILDFCKVESQAESKPSFVFINGITTSKQFSEVLGEKYQKLESIENVETLDTTPSFYNTTNEDNADSIIEKIIINRNNKNNVNNLFIVIDRLEETGIKDLHKYITLGRSRNVYFIVLIANAELLNKLYSSEDYEIISSNCHLHFICNNDQILEIQYHNAQVKNSNQTDTIKLKK